MRKWNTIFLVVFLILAINQVADATPEVVGNTIIDDFEDAWTGSYAPGWQNIDYRWGTASSSVMTQQNTYVYSGLYGLCLSITGAGDPVSDTDWWGGVEPTFVSDWALDKQYNPWVSVWFYDLIETNENALPSGYLAAVPETGIPDDWTDLQLGTRWGYGDFYYYGNAPANGGVGWTATSIPRSEGWHEFKMTLSSSGILDYYIDSSLVGTSPRTDYDNLIDIYLGVWLASGDFGNSDVYYDYFTIGSDAIPEPGALMMLGSLATGLFGVFSIKRRFHQN